MPRRRAGLAGPGDRDQERERLREADPDRERDRRASLRCGSCCSCSVSWREIEGDLDASDGEYDGERLGPSVRDTTGGEAMLAMLATLAMITVTAKASPSRLCRSLLPLPYYCEQRRFFSRNQAKCHGTPQ